MWTKKPVFTVKSSQLSTWLLSVSSAGAGSGSEGEEAGPPSRGWRRRGDLQEVPDDAAHGIHPARHAAVRRQPGRHGQQVKYTVENGLSAPRAQQTCQISPHKLTQSNGRH